MPFSLCWRASISSLVTSSPSSALYNPSLHSLDPRRTAYSDLYLSGMDESQVWFKCPNYSPELWCPALRPCCPVSVAPLWKLARITEPFTEARLRARPHERLSPCNQPMESRQLVWRANHMETLWPAQKSLHAVLGFIWHSSFILWTLKPGTVPVKKKKKIKKIYVTMSSKLTLTSVFLDSHLQDIWKLKI